MAVDENPREADSSPDPFTIADWPGPPPTLLYGSGGVPQVSTVHQLEDGTNAITVTRMEITEGADSTWFGLARLIRHPSDGRTEQVEVDVDGHSTLFHLVASPMVRMLSARDADVLVIITGLVELDPPTALTSIRPT